MESTEEPSFTVTNATAFCFRIDLTHPDTATSEPRETFLSSSRCDIVRGSRLKLFLAFVCCLHGLRDEKHLRDMKKHGSANCVSRPQQTLVLLSSETTRFLGLRRGTHKGQASRRVLGGPIFHRLSYNNGNSGTVTAAQVHP